MNNIAGALYRVIKVLLYYCLTQYKSRIYVVRLSYSQRPLTSGKQGG